MVTMTVRDAELLQRRQSQRQHDGGAVRIGDDLALPAALALLARDELQVIGIDLRHEQRHIRLHAMIARVRDHDVAGLGKGALDLGGDQASMAEKSRRGALPGLHSCTVRSATLSGMPPSRRQLVASRYFLPAERSLAPSHVRSNHGWSCRNLMKCWPTMPVAPRIPTSILVCINLFSLRADRVPSVDKFPLLRAAARFGTRSSERVRDVDGAGAEQKRLAPCSAERRDIGGVRDDGGLESIERCPGATRGSRAPRAASASRPTARLHGCARCVAVVHQADQDLGLALRRG